MAEIELKKVTKKYDDHAVIENLDLKIPDGRFTILVGPSGCGKTTLLRMIAGIEPTTDGEVIIDGQNMNSIQPSKRSIAMVFQNYAIYPTMTVRGNIEFGLKNNRVPKEERNRRIADVCKTVGLTEYLSRKPSTLSGGQRQRVALARAMVKNPQVFLMDEPLSNLDAKLRTSMRTELIELHERIGATFVYVTHDQVEAMAMADMIVLMNEGKIMQTGSPSDIYLDPENVFAAQFIGTPSMNIIKNGNADNIQFGFRPEKAILTSDKTDMVICSRGKVMTREMLGAETIYKIRVNDISIMAKSADDSFKVNDTVYISLSEDSIYYFNESGERLKNGDDSSYLKLLMSAGGFADE